MADVVVPEIATSAKVETRHAAAAILGETRAQQEDVLKIQTLRQEKEGQGMFRAVSGREQEAVAEPDFYDIDRAEAVRIRESGRCTKDSSEQKTINERAKNLKINADVLKEIYEQGDLSPATIEAISHVLAKIPGFYTAIASHFPGQTPESVQLALKNGTVDNITGLREIIESHLKSDGMKQRLAKIFSQVGYKGEEIDNLSADIETLEDDIKQKEEAISKEKQRRQQAVDYVKKNPTELTNTGDAITALDQTAKELGLNINNLSIQYIEQQKNSIEARYSELIKQRNHPNYSQETEDSLKVKLDNYKQLENYYKEIIAPIKEAGNLSKLDIYKLSQLTESELIVSIVDQKQLNKDKNTLISKRHDRKSLQEKYEGNVNSTLERSIKGYFQEVILTEARENAQAEARKKEEDKTNEEGREKKTEDLLDNFMKLSFFKWNYDTKAHGQAVDKWDDTWIKDTVHAIKSHGPEGMARILIQRLLNQRGSLPTDIRDNIEEVLKKINKDSPGDPLTALSGESLRKIGTKFVPILFGAAKARGYSLERFKLTGPQAEAMMANYGPDFWDKINENFTKFNQEAEKVFGQLNIAGGLGRKIRQELSADNIMQNKLAFLLKLLGILGVVGLSTLLPGIGPLLAVGGLAGGAAAIGGLKSKS